MSIHFVDYQPVMELIPFRKLFLNSQTPGAMGDNR